MKDTDPTIPPLPLHLDLSRHTFPLRDEIYESRLSLDHDANLDDDYSVASPLPRSPGFSNERATPFSMVMENIFLRRQFSTVEPERTSSDFEAALSILKYYLSVGILALPYIFFLTGYLLGALLIIIVTLMTAYSVNLLHQINMDMWVKGEDKINYTFSELSLKVLGPLGQLVCRVFSSISNIGSCLAYIMFFEMYISQIIREEWSHKLDDEQVQLIGALCAFVIILPLSSINSVALFWHTNFLGLILGLSAIFLMISRDVSLIISTGDIELGDNYLWKTENLPYAIGIIVYSFKIMGIAMIVRSNMDNPKHFPRIFNLSTTFTAFIYLLFAVATQLALGEYAAEVALLNFSPQTFLGFIVHLFYTISILLSYPLKFYVVILMYENFSCFKKNIFDIQVYNNRQYQTSYTAQVALIKRYAARYLLILVIFMITLFTFKLTKFISLIGSLGGIINQFVIPQIIHLKYFKNLSFFRIALGVFIALTCVVASFMGVYRSLKEGI